MDKDKKSKELKESIRKLYGIGDYPKAAKLLLNLELNDQSETEALICNLLNSENNQVIRTKFIKAVEDAMGSFISIENEENKYSVRRKRNRLDELAALNKEAGKKRFNHDALTELEFHACNLANEINKEGSEIKKNVARHSKDFKYLKIVNNVGNKIEISIKKDAGKSVAKVVVAAVVAAIFIIPLAIIAVSGMPAGIVSFNDGGSGEVVEAMGSHTMSAQIPVNLFGEAYHFEITDENGSASQYIVVSSSNDNSITYHAKPDTPTGYKYVISGESNKGQSFTKTMSVKEPVIKIAEGTANIGANQTLTVDSNCYFPGTPYRALWTVSGNATIIDGNNGKDVTVLVGTDAEIGDLITLRCTACEGSMKTGFFDEKTFVVTEELGLAIYGPDGKISAGNEYDIKAAFTPYDLKNETVEWSTDKPEMVSIVENNHDATFNVIVSAKEGFSFTITAENEKYGLKAEKTFVISDQIELSIEGALKEYKTGEKYTVSAVFTPADMKDDKMVWSVNKENLVTLIPNGQTLEFYLNPAAKTGDIITLSVKNTTCNVEASKTFTAVNNLKIALRDISENVDAGKEIIIDASVAPSNIIYDVVWSKDSTSEYITLREDDSDVCHIYVGSDVKNETKFTVTGTLKGTDISASKQFVVKNDVKMEISSDYDKMLVSKENEISISFSKKETTDDTISWSVPTGNASVVHKNEKTYVIVDELTKSGDTVKIKAESSKFDLKAEKSFSVDNDLSIKISPEKQLANTGGSASLVASVKCADDYVIEWTSSSDEITYDITDGGNNCRIGIPFDHPLGTITVTAKVKGTSESATATIDISKPDYILSLRDISSDVYTGKTYNITAILTPNDPSVYLDWCVNGDINERGYCSLAGNNRTATLIIAEDARDGIEFTVTVAGKGTNIVCNKTLVINKTMIEITEAKQMMDVAKNPGGYYTLEDDIDMSSVRWSPFAFSGNFNGNGHKLMNLTVDGRNTTYGSTTFYAGMFTRNNGSIYDLTLEDFNIMFSPDNYGKQSYVYAGVLAGQNSGSITNCKIVSSTVDAHTSNIEHMWLYSHSRLPKQSEFTGPRSGAWYEYASLRFTGIECNSWTPNGLMAVYCGGMVGSNSGSITGCAVNNSSITGKVVNFNYSSTDSSYARAYVGGLAGFNSSALIDCSSDSKVYATLSLHDSGDGSGVGLGYVNDYSPAAVGYVGGLAGYTTVKVNGTFSGTYSAFNDVYAPVYCTFIYPPAGAHYDTNKSNTNDITWYKGVLSGNMN